MRMWTYYFKYKIGGALEEYKRSSSKNKCIYCKKCEEKCLYNVPIIQNLKSLESIVKKHK
jgi:predicted aldo/keto reductase-like oxidoreductase